MLFFKQQIHEAILQRVHNCISGACTTKVFEVCSGNVKIRHAPDIRQAMKHKGTTVI